MVDAAVNVRLISDYGGVTVTLKSSTNKNHYNTKQYNTIQCSSAQSTKT